MKILFFISVHGHGRGGHFHSLNHISQKIGEQHEVKIISFGPGRSDIIEANPHFHQHIKFKGFDLFKLMNIIKKESRVFNPDIYHCFDEGSYNIVRLIIPSNKYKIVLSKCGGPNPIYYPTVNNLILFSLENQKWFQSQNKFRRANIHLIPNRVKPLIIIPKFYQREKISNEFVFMRICRIGHSYKKSIQDSINLISILLARGLNKIKLYVIGVVQDADVFEKFNNHELVKNGNVIFLTDTTYTTEASKMLYLADVVIGTGRGLMEASSLGKPMLSIDKNGEIPILLTGTYFNDAFETNFSERNAFDNLNNIQNINNITQLITDKNYYKDISEFTSICFDKHFNLDKVSEAYPNVYEKSSTGKRKLLVDSLLIFKSLYSFYRSFQILK